MSEGGILGSVVLALLWTFVVPIVRSRIHFVHRVILGTVSMIVGIGVLIFAAMLTGSVHGGFNDSQVNGVFFISAIIVICLPFLVVAIAGNGKRREASNVGANKDV